MESPVNIQENTLTTEEKGDLLIHIIDDKYDKYELCENDEKLEKILADKTLIQLLFDKITDDIVLDKFYAVHLYLHVLNTLVKNGQILSTWGMRLSKKEITTIFDRDVNLAIILIYKNILTFEQLLKYYTKSKLSKEIMNEIYNYIVDTRLNIVDICTTNAQMDMRIVCSTIDKMVESHIAVNVQYFAKEDVKYLLDVYTFDKKYQHELYFNMFQNFVPPDIFTDATFVNTIEYFFNTAKFSHNFDKFHHNTIVAYGNYINKPCVRYLLNFYVYDRMLKYWCDDDRYKEPSFVKNLMILLPIIQTTILKDVIHLNMYDYSVILKGATSTELKNLHFKTIIEFGLCDTFDYIRVINDVVLFAVDRDGIDIKTIRNKFASYTVASCVMINIVKLIVLLDKTQSEQIVDLLFFMLERPKLFVFNSHEMDELKNVFAGYKNNSSIVYRLIHLDNDIVDTVFTIFPDCSRCFDEMLKLQIENFTRTIRGIKSIVNGENICDRLSLFSTIHSINNIDRFTCAICTTNQINHFFTLCGHTICDKCSVQVDGKCPFCNCCSQTKPLFNM